MLESKWEVHVSRCYHFVCIAHIFVSPLHMSEKDGGQGQSTYGGPGQDKHT